MAFNSVSGQFQDLSEVTERLYAGLLNMGEAEVTVTPSGDGFSLTRSIAVTDQFQPRSRTTILQTSNFCTKIERLLFNAMDVDVPAAHDRLTPLLSRWTIQLERFTEWVRLRAEGNFRNTLRESASAHLRFANTIDYQLLDLQEILGRTPARTGISAEDLNPLYRAIDLFETKSTRVENTLFYGGKRPITADLLKPWVTAHERLVEEGLRARYFLLPKVPTTVNAKLAAATETLMQLLEEIFYPATEVVTLDASQKLRFGLTPTIADDLRMGARRTVDVGRMARDLLQPLDALFAGVEKTFAASARYYANHFVRPVITIAGASAVALIFGAAILYEMRDCFTPSVVQI